MSMIFYVVRQKKNKNLFYKRRTSGGEIGGWVEGVKHASVWTSYQGPTQVLKVVGKEYGEMVAVTGLLQPGEYNTIYAIRHIPTGRFVANRKHRLRGIFYSARWDDAGVWTRPNHAKSLIRAWTTYCKHPKMLQHNIDVKPEELEIIKMPVFVPPREII